jgi:hypothetical protein
MTQTRLKVSDFDSTHDAGWPLITAPYDNRSPWGNDNLPKRTLHISRRYGKYRVRDYYSNDPEATKEETRRYTECNRPFEHWEFLGEKEVNLAVHGEQLPDGSLYFDFKLCPRCGSAEDFYAAIAERREIGQKATAEREALEERQRQARHRYLHGAKIEWLHLLSAIKADGNLLIQGDEDEDGYYIRIAGGEFYFHLQRYPRFADNLETINERVEKEVE